MYNPISEKDIQEIISNFKTEISEYEVIDMEKYQGWSSKYLYLLVSSEGNFVLKAKTQDQIAGYDNEVKVCQALLLNGIKTRSPVLTKDGSIFYEKDGYYWCLMKYVPGTPSIAGEYNAQTIESLADHINQYVEASITNTELKDLDIVRPWEKDDLYVLDKFIEEYNFLESEKILKTKDISGIYSCIKEGYRANIQKVKTRSIIHNDLNPKNILMDPETKKVIAFIDWDHVRHGNPLKDVSDTVAIFYDFLNINEAVKFKKLLYSKLTANWFTQIDTKTVDLAFLFYYTTAKWQAILFYLDLLKKYDNKYGERSKFVNEMKQTYDKWLSVATRFK